MLVWIIEASLPGVTNQCIGVARAIATLGTCRMERVKLRLRSRLLQPIFRFALRRNLLDDYQAKLSARLLSSLLFSGLPRGGERPDISVSALGRGELAAAYLRRSKGTIALHIGIPSRMPSACFDFIISLASQDTSSLHCPSVSLDITPTPVLLRDVRARAEAVGQWKEDRDRLWAVLVGGDGAGYSYRPDEWEILAQSLKTLGGAFGASFLITTSRRTGVAAEAVLKAYGPAEAALADATWYSEHPRNVVVDYLAAAEVVFCTEDSRSMISDAIAAGKAVYAVRPESAAATPRLAEFLAIQEAKRRIKRIPIAKLAAVDIDDDLASYFQPLTECWSSTLLSALNAELPELRRHVVEHGRDQSDPV